MSLIISLNELCDKIRTFSYKTRGDVNEIQYSERVIDKFPRAEQFWKYFITPTTNRIDNIGINPIGFRSEIADALQDLASIHYSIYMKLVYASFCRESTCPSSFDSFYAHLGSTCDLAEDFLIQCYFITLNCEQRKTAVLQEMSKTEFLEMAGEWYDKHYLSVYEHYLNKGKYASCPLIQRSSILDEYLGESVEWESYKRFSQEIRTYRNVVVHNTQIGALIIDGIHLVPIKKQIGEYKKWRKIANVKQSNIEKHFIKKNKLMEDDLNTLKIMLNDLWKFPCAQLNKLFYEDKNDKLLEMYNIKFDNLIEPSNIVVEKKDNSDYLSPSGFISQSTSTSGDRVL